MRIPLWITGPAVIALSAVDAAIEIQNRVVGALTRAVIRRMDPPAQPVDPAGAHCAMSQLTWLSRGAFMDFAEEVQSECDVQGPRTDAGDSPFCGFQRGHGGRHRPGPDEGWRHLLCWGGR